MKGAKWTCSHMHHNIIPCLPRQPQILLESHANGVVKFSLLQDVLGRNRVARPLAIPSGGHVRSLGDAQSRAISPSQLLRHHQVVSRCAGDFKS